MGVRGTSIAQTLFSPAINYIEIKGRMGATRIKLNLAKHALNGHYLPASTFNFNKLSFGQLPGATCDQFRL